MRFTTSIASIHGRAMLPKFPETAISLSYNSHHSLGGSYPSMRVLVHGYTDQTNQAWRPLRNQSYAERPRSPSITPWP